MYYKVEDLWQSGNVLTILVWYVGKTNSCKDV